MNQLVIAVLGGAYVAGSWNFAITLLKALGKTDPRTVHSGNAGVTNVARIAGKPAAALVLILDMGRAIGLQALAAHLLPAAWVPWAGLALVLGNRYPLFHGCKGGKGVANYLGFVAGASPLGGAIACVAWVLTWGVSGIPAIASMAMLVALAISASMSWPFGILSIAATALTGGLIVAAHAPNFRALAQKNR
jgi:acyl phosphate:glycerol-3-phosphate acyltransferase